MHSPVKGTYSGVLIYMCKHEENEFVFEFLGRNALFL